MLVAQQIFAVQVLERQTQERGARLHFVGGRAARFSAIAAVGDVRGQADRAGADAAPVGLRRVAEGGGTGGEAKQDAGEQDPGARGEFSHWWCRRWWWAAGELGGSRADEGGVDVAVSVERNEP